MRHLDAFMDPDAIRMLFSRTLSDMYQAEVPQYGNLLDLVAGINGMDGTRPRVGDRLEVERHGAIRVGTADELSAMRRLFAVMGMVPIGYYDLSPAGVPVHSTAFRPTEPAALERNPFRVFTSLLRLDLIDDTDLRERAARILGTRRIFTPDCLELIALQEAQGGLSETDARRFVAEALETFRWHGDATVDIETYRQLRASHPLVADVVCFKGPHINHLTPRVLDIDMAHRRMKDDGMRVKASIEGPPSRRWPILLRQTSFLAIEEPIRFAGTQSVDGTHTARFGEIEQRGGALTPKGRQLYDRLLAQAQAQIAAAPTKLDAAAQAKVLARVFEAFPDDLWTLHHERLAFFRYAVAGDHDAIRNRPTTMATLDALIEEGLVRVELQTYEDFLPVSAAGIFQSNLGQGEAQAYRTDDGRASFEAALGMHAKDEFELYRHTQAVSLRACLHQLGIDSEHVMP